MDFFGFESEPAINNLGMVAFVATLDTGGRGIFTGADPVADKVIRVGDALDGSTVSILRFFIHGLNDGGQLAFRAGLADGRSGVYRADPVVQQVIPEPTTVTLLVIGLVGVGVAAWRRKKK